MPISTRSGNLLKPPYPIQSFGCSDRVGWITQASSVTVGDQLQSRTLRIARLEAHAQKHTHLTAKRRGETLGSPWKGKKAIKAFSPR